MTHPTGSYQPGDPVAATRHDGVEAPVRPVLAAGRGLRQRAGLIVVAVVAITVVAAGIGLGGRGLEPAASGSPSGSGSEPDASGPGSSDPRPSPGSEGSLDCGLVEVDDLPEPRLWSTAGDVAAKRGIAGPDWQLASPPTSAWPVP
ncbi:MAG TPA: hypothetical protein VFX65_07065, partial [Candidatus Limnocylindrales bacterium]|nr:hypothetical protein [Candidatus Limnocylindrales bacterium]